jgi:hypothetical protein
MKDTKKKGRDGRREGRERCEVSKSREGRRDREGDEGWGNKVR